MNPEAQRIAIAEACGWINQGRRKGVRALDDRWLMPGSVSAFAYTRELPNYLNDLNAMHEAEKVLIAREDGGNDYWNKLEAVVHGSEMLSHVATIHATAAQRAEAFLWSLNGRLP